MTQNDPLIGQVIADRYQILELLGAGGMGRVYLAEHVRMGRRCAVKVMSPSLALAPDAISRFNREAANASRINHPNVAQIYDFGDTGDGKGTLYLAMELIEGETLTRMIERQGPLPIARAAAMTKQIADALGAAHHLGIVHRDLKPENIMIARHLDGSDWVKVVDFGIAKTTQQEGQGSQTVTTAGVSLGTPEYMSPEQLAGERLDQRSDIYALGLVCFHMLTGDLPYPRLTSRETLVKRLTSRPRTLAEVRPGTYWPGPLQRALDRALAPETAERYANVADFSRDVMRAAELAGDPEKTVRLDPAVVAPAVAAGPSGRTRVIEPVEPARRRSLVAPILLAIAVIGLGAAAASRYPTGAARLSAKVAGLLPSRFVAVVDESRALDSAARQPLPADSASGQPRTQTVATAASVPAIPAAAQSRAADSTQAPAPTPVSHDSVAQQGAASHVAPAVDTTVDDDSSAAPAHPTPAAPQTTRAAVTPPPVTTGASTGAAAPAPVLGEHNWLRANGDSGAPRVLGPNATDADRLRAIGEEIEGHIERANQIAGRGEFQRSRGDFLAAARELSVVRTMFPGVPAVQRLQRSLVQSVRRAYTDCHNFSADTSSLGGGFRCEDLLPRRPGAKGMNRGGGQQNAGVLP